MTYYRLGGGVASYRLNNAQGPCKHPMTFNSPFHWLNVVGSVRLEFQYIMNIYMRSFAITKSEKDATRLFYQWITLMLPVTQWLRFRQDGTLDASALGSVNSEPD
jgi:hypothetical protein